jgi:zinc transport system ATP-binding protein
MLCYNVNGEPPALHPGSAAFMSLTPHDSLLPHDPIPAAASTGFSAPAPLLVDVRALTLRHGPRTVLRSVDLTVRAGQIVTVIGPNGAGKTSLVRLVLGLLKTDSGTVWQRPGLRVGYMPQRLQIDPTLPLTVRRFLTLWGPSSSRMISRLLAEVGVPQVEDRAVQSLSGGELQRVLLARALLRQPDLLVLDEPVQAVDVQGQADLYALIADLSRSRNCGVLMVSHDLHLVMARTDIVVCLNGHVCCQGVPEHVGQHPEFVALFGRAAPALAIYHHHHDHGHAADGCAVPLGQEQTHHHG